MVQKYVVDRDEPLFKTPGTTISDALLIDTPIFNLPPIVLIIYRVLSLIFLIGVCATRPIQESDPLILITNGRYYTYWNLYYSTLTIALLLLLPSKGISQISQFKIDLLTSACGLQFFLSVFYWTLLFEPGIGTADFIFQTLTHGGVFVIDFIHLLTNKAVPSWYPLLYSFIISLPYLVIYFVVTNILKEVIYSTDIVIVDAKTFGFFVGFIVVLTLTATISTALFIGLKKLLAPCIYNGEGNEKEISTMDFLEESMIL